MQAPFAQVADSAFILDPRRGLFDLQPAANVVAMPPVRRA
jgi:hypothetical protein